MWNPFKKIKSSASNFAINMASRVAMKKAAKMSPQEREKMMREAFDPGNKGKLIQALEIMRKSGQVNEEQYQMAKKKLGL